MIKRSLLLLLSGFIVSGCGGGGSSTTTTTDTTPPVFTSTNTASVPENQTSSLTVQASDTSTVTYSITSGLDQTLFSINSFTGVLTFNSTPDFEIPADNNADNDYLLTVTATDTSFNASTQDIIITVTDVDEGTAAVDSDNDSIPDDIEIMLTGDIDTISDPLATDAIYGDPFFDMQWHIHSLGSLTNDSNVPTILGNDLDIIDVYQTYMGFNSGTNIIVQVVDTGVDADHEDLVNNMDLSRSYDGDSVGDPSSNIEDVDGDYTHGTMVAGIMAAEAFNGKGVRGISPFSKIAGSNWLETQRISQLEKVWYTGIGANEVAVSNNSWGSYFDTDTFYEDYMALGTSNLRDGKGRIYVFAAGNDRQSNGNANLQYPINNRYVIAVSALKHDNTHADYSTPGANILVSGYSGNFYQDSPTISTTTAMGASSNTGNINTKTTWTDDTQENYTFIMNGTSAAAPTVAASVALVLEACPALTWRDVKYLIAKHAKQVDAGHATWMTNSMGFNHSIQYGFGLINAKDMITECTSTYTNLPVETVTTAFQAFNAPITDNNTTHSFRLNVGSINIEWVEVTVDNNSTYASDYRVELTSPQGSKTTLMTDLTDATQLPTDAWMNGGFRLSTPAMLNEDSQGEWKIDITDVWAVDTGTLKSIALKIYGH